MDASNLMVTLMGVVKLNEPQHKNKCQESGRGPGRQEELMAGGGDGESSRMQYIHTGNCQRTYTEMGHQLRF